MCISRVGGIEKVNADPTSSSSLPRAACRRDDESAVRHISLAIGVPQKPVWPSSSGMILAQAALAHQRVRDRHFERLGERGELRVARAGQHAAAGVEDGPLARGERVDDRVRRRASSRRPAISAGTFWNASTGRSAEKMSIGTSTSTGPGVPSARGGTRAP
jgi:hypothetical protein